MRYQLLALVLVACGGSTATPDAAPVDAGIDTSIEEDAGDEDVTPMTYPAPHPPLPQVVNSGGFILKAPKVIPIFFPSDPNVASLVDFAQKLGPTPYWSANTIEYGVGPLVSKTAIQLSETAPTEITDDEIQAWLKDKLDGAHVDFGKADESAIYTIYYPGSTTIQLGTQYSCQSFGGYHNAIDLGGIFVPYAIIPDCGTFAGLSGVDALTAVTSHELVEAATDPYPSLDPAYSHIDNDHVVWSFLIGGGETADMCAQYSDSHYKPSGFDYYVQRSWSNKAAQDSHEPCVPALLPVYFNTAPVLDETVTLDAFGITTKGVTIPVGQEKTIELDLFSDGPTEAWEVSVAEPAFGGKHLDLLLDKSSGQNGDKLSLTIKATASSQYGGSAFIITSTLGAKKHYWAGLVRN